MKLEGLVRKTKDLEMDIQDVKSALLKLHSGKFGDIEKNERLSVRTLYALLKSCEAELDTLLNQDISVNKANGGMEFGDL